MTKEDYGGSWGMTDVRQTLREKVAAMTDVEIMRLICWRCARCGAGLNPPVPRESGELPHCLRLESD